jgi:aspartyl-tRNA(Asn)/glutamyl-tRNA(Gln) amidotransferase subunit A
MSVPAGFAASEEAGEGGGGMPVGLQLIGNYFAEGLLLRTAHALQQASDWHLAEPQP